MTPGRNGREPHPDRVLRPGESWENVTVRIIKPRTTAALKVLMARWDMRSYGAVLRRAAEECAGLGPEKEQGCDS